MTREEYEILEGYMLDCMKDSAHDKEHVYRVLFQALEIAEEEAEADRDLLTAACLLHDIGREEQFENPNLCHAEVGSHKAYEFLLQKGWEKERAGLVRDCIKSHRYRSENPPTTLEAKILFDADKLDVAGAVGIARTLLYNGKLGRPLEPDFFREYQFKLKTLYDKFYTERGRKLAKKRQAAAELFYNSLDEEIHVHGKKGEGILRELLGEIRQERNELLPVK